MSKKEATLQSTLDKIVDDKKIFGTSFAIKKDALIWSGTAGDLSSNQPYFIASTTKLFTSAIILHLKSKGELSLEDTISKYLDTSIVDKLHLYNGKDYSNDLTIKHLLAHTSGLADYFEGKGASGKSLKDDLMAGNDQSWTFEQAIEKTKAMKPLFTPGTKNKAHYSDTNYQLLGKIIETITKKPYSSSGDEQIIKPLGLARTYVYQDPTDDTPKTLYCGSRELHIPQAMASFGSDGGIVSTSTDMLIFIEAFFTGKVFPEEYITELQEWNRIFSPLQAGVGIHLFKLPWIFTLGAAPSFIGHSGLSGALAYYSPEKNIFVAGTVNQVTRPGASFRAMIRLAQVCNNLV